MNPAPSPLLHSLLEADRAHPTARKIVVGPTQLWGREALRALARRIGGWAGWEAATLRSLADELAFTALSDIGKRSGTDIEIGALIGAAIDRAVSDGAVSPSWTSLVTHAGFRTAIGDGLLELRTAGLGAAGIRGVEGSAAVHDLAAVLERFDSLLDQHRLVDPAGVFMQALASLDEEARFVLDARLFLAPGLTTRGLPGRLVEQLLKRGAQLLGWSSLTADTPPPSLVECHGGSAVSASTETDMFVAATPSDEVRQALRRAIAEGYRLDDVELVATDVDTYGTALDALCRNLGISATLQEGLPHQRSRIGRAVARQLDWMEQGLLADLLREALEAGDITSPAADATPDPAILARALRSLRIGWGRARYDAAREALDSGKWAKAELERHRDDESEDSDDLATTLSRIAADLSALLGHLLAALPPIPELGARTSLASTPQAIARALLQFLDLVPVPDPADRFNRDRLRGRLQQLAEVEEAERPFGSALAAVREALNDFRVWTQLPPDATPRLSRGGAVHLTDLGHAGATGRKRIFVLGLDADRVAGPRVSDPILPDGVRQALPGLATTADRRREVRWLVGRAIAGLSGRVTLSFAREGSQGEETGPGAVLLDVARKLANDPALDYKGLRSRLGSPSCPVPESDDFALDRRDAWLGAIGAGDLLLDGTTQVRGAHPGLDAGLGMFESLDADEITPHHGLVSAAAGRFDPTVAGGHSISASSLERLSRCPLSWFYQYALDLTVLDDPGYDPDLWLDSALRGSVLHSVFEQFVKAYRGRQRELLTERAQADLLEICDARLASERESLPPPSEIVFQAEREEIIQAAKSFLTMERRLHRLHPPVTWEEAEYGIGGSRAVVKLPDGSAFRMKGRIDRIDALDSGRHLILDYKTGSTYPYRRVSKAGPLNGGRHLQPALYSAAYEAMTGRKIDRFEYRFPTAKGRNEIIAHRAADLAQGLGIVPGVIAPLRSGAFLPTIDADDCKYCDHRSICRVGGDQDRFEKVDSPRVRWAKDHGVGSELYAAMESRRTP